MMQAQNHNVIIFGAGASADAGIPLLGSFVDTMWEYAFKGKAGTKEITPEDRQVLVAADSIRQELERYNSRANFDIRNLEDILSLLSFESLSGPEQNKKYETLVSAVSRTIELSCKFQYLGETPMDAPDPATSYSQLWSGLLKIHSAANPLALLTFNYDLVLERTLWNHFHFQDSWGLKPSAPSCGLDYCLGNNNFTIVTEPHKYGKLANFDGRRARILQGGKQECPIPYLKLHGSLNWTKGQRLEDPDVRPNNLPTEAVAVPLILPPVFNKMKAGEVDSVWMKALEALRNAKHIIIVGYSLPKTDIYMQYFLKAAVGPNSNLQRLIVFDPALFQPGSVSAEMRKRYEECFAPQFTNRISFSTLPLDASHPQSRDNGTLKHFVRILNNAPQALFFYP